MRTWFGGGVVVCHLLLFFLLFFFYVRGGFLSGEMMTSLGLMAPMFASFVAIVVDELTDSSPVASASVAKMRGAFVFMSWLFLLAYAGFMVTIIVLKAYNIGIDSFDDFKLMIAAGETFCGVYLARFVKTLFQKP
jgi:hypothetical protein